MVLPGASGRPGTAPPGCGPQSLCDPGPKLEIRACFTLGRQSGVPRCGSRRTLHDTPEAGTLEDGAGAPWPAGLGPAHSPAERGNLAVLQRRERGPRHGTGPTQAGHAFSQHAPQRPRSRLTRRPTLRSRRPG